MIGKIKNQRLRRAAIVLAFPVVFLIFAAFALVGALVLTIEDIRDAW